MISGNTVEHFVKSLPLEQNPRLLAPDGRPLYGYRVLPDRYEKLANRLRFQFPEILRGKVSQHLAAGFVLYAAETWRRNEDISRWNSWDVVLAGLGQHDVPLQDLYPAVQLGLRYWRRDLRKLGGRNMYLATLVCEGGLPLHLVQGSQSPFRRYLRELVAHARDFGTAQAVLATAAERLADVLPRSLRHEVVHEMAAELVARLVELHRKADGCNGDPIDYLDLFHENWRDTLPLRLDDALARTLLRELLQDVREVTAARGALPRVHRWLQQREEGFCLRARLDVPRSSKLARIKSLWGSQQEFPNHAKLAIVTGSAAQAPFGTAFRRQENVSFEVACSRRAEVEHGEAAANLRLEVDAGTKVGDTRILDVPGGQALSPSQPWVFFREEGDGGRVVLIADGSCRTRHAEVMVAVPKGMQVLADEDGSVEGVAQRIPALDRDLHVCRGRVRFENLEGDVWFVATAQEGDTLLEFDLGGNRLDGCSSNSTQFFRGAPRVVARDATGDPVRPPAHESEWRPARGGGAWTLDPQSALGLVEVRVRVEEGTRLRRKIAVLPENFDWRLQETGPQAGTLRLEGIGGGAVLVKQVHNLDVELRIFTDLDAIDLHCSAVGDPPASLSIQIVWEDAVPVDLVLPSPIRSGFFVTGEGTKVERDYVPVDDLYAFRVQLVTAEKRVRYALRGRLTSREGVAGASLSEINRNIHLCLPLREVSEGRYEAELRHLVDPVQRAMRVVPQLDLQVLLRLEKNGTEQPGLQLEVQRYGATLECNWEEAWVGIKTMSPVIEGRENDIRVRTFPLWLPTKPDEELPALPTETPTWSFDAPSTELGTGRREPGPWFLHGSLEGRACTRPRIWVVSGEASIPQGNLHKQAVLAAPEGRDIALRALYAGLKTGSDDAAWTDLMALLERCDHLPAAGFDTLRGLVLEPALLVALLVEAKGKLRETVFELREELPFDWSMLPLSAWVEGCQTGLRRLGSQYTADGLGAEDVRECVKLRFLRLVAWLPAGEQVLRDLLHWVGSSLVDGIEPPPELRMAAKPAQFLQVVQVQLETAWMEMLRRRTHDTEWPQFHRLSTWEPPDTKLALPTPTVGDVTSWQRSVLRAPWVAACMALGEESADPVTTLGLLQSRTFDSEWFDLAHRMYLVAAMALHTKHRRP